MTRTEILQRVENYFALHELVDKQVMDKYGQKAWQFLDTDALHCLLIIRRGLDRSITVNDWYWNGDYSQRGLRHNKSSIVKRKSGVYLSAHCLGKAFDFNVKGMNSDDVRAWIIDNADLLPCKIRLERYKSGKSISWVHIDTYDLESSPKIYIFDV